MKKPALIAALVYGTTTICLFGFREFLSGIGVPTSRLAYLLIAGNALFAIACTLSFFRMRLATTCAVVGAALSWPMLSSQFTAFGRDSFWELTYHPSSPAAIASLLVASIYALVHLRLFLKPTGNASGHKTVWALPIVVIYAVTMVAIANWPRIWDLCFKTRYGG